MKKSSIKRQLFHSIKNLILAAQNQIVHNVNSIMVLTYFRIGHFIGEDELQGKDRADYAEKTMRQLSLDLTKEFGKGYSKSNLEYMRQFYKLYQDRYKQITQPMIGQSRKKAKIVQAAMGQSLSPFVLSWTHYIQLLKIQNDSERNFYEIEASTESWSVRELQRQINSSLYERLALSRDKKSIKELSKRGQLIERPADTLRNPVVLEFLDLKEDATYMKLIWRTQLSASLSIS